MKHLAIISFGLILAASCGGEVPVPLTERDKIRIETAHRLGRGCILSNTSYGGCRDFCQDEFVYGDFSYPLKYDLRDACWKGVTHQQKIKSDAMEQAQ